MQCHSPLTSFPLPSCSNPERTAARLRPREPGPPLVYHNCPPPAGTRSLSTWRSAKQSCGTDLDDRFAYKNRLFRRETPAFICSSRISGHFNVVNNSLAMASSSTETTGNEEHRTPLCSSDEFLASSFDHVIVGGGTAGLVLANRLSEDPKVHVGVLEAGPAMLNDPMILTPGLATQGMSHPDSNWMFKTTPQVSPASNRLIRRLSVTLM